MRYTLTREQFALIEHLLPRHSNARKSGRKWVMDDYTNLEAILYVLRTGCSWRDVPDTYGKWYTVYMRYVRWMESGVFGRILLALQKIKPMKLQIVCLDSTSVKVHPSASWATKKRALKPFEDPKDDSLLKYTDSSHPYTI